MPKRRIISLALSLSLMLSCMGLSGCLGLINTETVAATVGKSTISEQAVTNYIEGFRSADESRETDSGWAQYLTNNGFTAESLRQYVLEHVFIPTEVIKLQCASRDIIVTDDELDQVIEQEREYYEQRYGSDTWTSVLASYGYDESSWRENEYNRLLEERLRAAVVKTPKPSNSRYLAYVNENAATYNGKHSYYLKFATEEEAQSAYSKIGVHVDAMTKRSFSNYGEVENGSWSSLKSAQDILGPAYLTALNGIDVGHVGEPVEVDGSWVIIYCDKSFIANDESTVKLSDIPTAIRKQLKSDLIQEMEDASFEKWLESATSRVHIVIEDMPSGLPYDVNVSISGS